MITDVDIKKMKTVFLTKDDAKSFTTKDDFKDLSKRFDSMDKRIEALANSQQKNTEELVELITSGFRLNEERFERLESKVFKAN